MISAVVGYDRSVNYWEAFEPGKLLQRLDALTLEAGQLPAVRNEAIALTQPLLTAQPKLDEDVYDDGAVNAETDIEEDAGADVETETEDIDTDIIDHVTADDEVELAEDLESAEAHSGEDYERSYEQFVRQYFDRVPDQGDDDEYDNEQQQQLDASIETQAEASSNVQKLKQKSGKKPKRNSKSASKEKHKRDGERCRRVHRKGQLCKICSEPRHNEVSETCSYSHAEEPEQYAYGSGSQYKRYRDKSPRKLAQEDEEEATEKEKREQPPMRPQRSERHTTILLQPSNQYNKNNTSSNSIAGSDSSLCVRRQQGKSVCYDCKDSEEKRMTRCYDAAVTKKHSLKSNAKPGKPRTRESQQSEQEQRIYKRTISYSYAQDSNSPDDQNENQEQLEPLLTLTSTASTTTAAAAIADNGIQVKSRPPGRKLARVVRRRVALPTPIPIPYRS